MDTLNQKFNIEITVLSPLSIGAGAEKDWVKGIDFVVKNKKLWVSPKSAKTLSFEFEKDGQKRNYA
ncbi:MAG: hypothetical protein LBT29_03675 [Flavobacteriaceae bacterium]|nr:hypothetical protein [Flavobacteriaceae bacterium]